MGDGSLIPGVYQGRAIVVIKTGQSAWARIEPKGEQGNALAVHYASQRGQRVIQGSIEFLEVVSNPC